MSSKEHKRKRKKMWSMGTRTLSHLNRGALEKELRQRNKSYGVLAGLALIIVVGIVLAIYAGWL